MVEGEARWLRMVPCKIQPRFGLGAAESFQNLLHGIFHTADGHAEHSRCNTQASQQNDHGKFIGFGLPQLPLGSDQHESTDFRLVRIPPRLQWRAVRRYLHYRAEKGIPLSEIDYETGGRPCMRYKLAE